MVRVIRAQSTLSHTTGGIILGMLPPVLRYAAEKGLAIQGLSRIESFLGHWHLKPNSRTRRFCVYVDIVYCIYMCILWIYVGPITRWGDILLALLLCLNLWLVVAVSEGHIGVCLKASKSVFLASVCMTLYVGQVCVILRRVHNN